MYKFLDVAQLVDIPFSYVLIIVAFYSGILAFSPAQPRSGCPVEVRQCRDPELAGAQAHGISWVKTLAKPGETLGFLGW